MPQKEKLHHQFEEEISFAQYVIKNAGNFMLLPLDNNIVKQLNDDMRLHCINISKFINSIKHILAKYYSPKNFGPIYSEKFNGILQLDNNGTNIDSIDTNTSNNTKPTESEHEAKKDANHENDEL